MAALRVADADIIFLPCGFFLLSFFFFSSPNLSRRRFDVYHTSTYTANLGCTSETCCTRLAENTGRKNVAKNRRLGTNAQICQSISSQLSHVSTTGKKLVKQQYLLRMSSQYGELRPTCGSDRFVSLGHYSKLQRLSCLGSVTARRSSSGRQPNFAALNRGCHLYSAGRPSRWALAHILVITNAIFLPSLVIGYAQLNLLTFVSPNEIRVTPLLASPSGRQRVEQAYITQLQTLPYHKFDRPKACLTKNKEDIELSSFRPMVTKKVRSNLTPLVFGSPQLYRLKGPRKFGERACGFAAR